MPTYANISNSTQTGLKGGYKPQLYFAQVEDIETWERPTVPGVAIGDTVKITDAHVLADGKAVYQWDAMLYSVTVTSEAIGDAGAREFRHTATVVVKGDHAATLEQMIAMLNDNKVIWLKDADCLTNNSYIQLGDDCNPVEVSPAFDGRNNGPDGGQKRYTITITSATKYFYLAALPAVAP
jgi:hypothetical protein